MLVMTLQAWCAEQPASDLNPVTVKPAPVHAPIVLAADGKAAITLSIMNPPSGSAHRLAIEELRECFQQIFGVALPVLTNQLPATGAALVVGDCPEARAAGLVPSALPPEGFVIKTAPERIFIVGHGEAANGTAWGVYEFIERVLDVRWYWPTHQGGRTLTTRSGQTVAPLWIEDAPTFRKREIWPGNPPGLSRLHTALRSGNSWPINLVVHAPHKWGPLFKQERPEIFQLSQGGQRDNIMLCYGNPKTLETYLSVIDKHMRGEAQPKEAAQIISGTAITVSPWDVEVACYCNDCRAMWNPDGGGYGSASRVLETFVAKLGREVKARWPSMVVLYLPYLNYTLASGKVEFPDNVEVQLCGMPGVALYKEPAVWDQFQGNIDQWAKLTRRPVQTWDYSCWPEDRTQAPYQYPHVLKRYYTHNQHQIVGSFINGVKDHWPRSNFSLYCWMKLLWHPEFDVDAAADEACRRLFGPAAQPMRRLWHLQSTRWQESRFPDGRLAAQSVYSKAFPKPVIDEMLGLLDEARKLAAADASVTQRIAYYATPFGDFYREYEFVVEGKGMVPLIIKKTGELPMIDGKLDEPAWQTATPVALKVHAEGPQAVREAAFPTQLRALWLPGGGLIFGFHMTEPNPGALQADMRTKDDGGLWHQDCIELFIDPSGRNEGSYYQLLLTAGSAVFDAKQGDAGWDCEGLKFAIHRGDDFWSVEVFVPAAAIGAELATSVADRVWSGQFTRHRMSDGVGGHENQKMNANHGGFNSNTGDFGELRFIE